MGQTAVDRNEVGCTVLSSAERFCTSSVNSTSKRLLYEFLALLGPDGTTLSGLSQSADARKQQPDVLGITRKFMGSHVVRHYYVKRQYDEATQVALGFLQFLRSDCEASLPTNFLAQLDAAIGVAKDGCEELPHIMRIIRQPDYLNEAYSFRYQSRPWPLCHVPQTTEIKESSSRCWPGDNEQHLHAWIGFASERCRIEPDELREVLAQVPTNLSIAARTEGIWDVKEVRPDNTILFQEWKGSQQFVVQFSARRAADFRPGQVICCTFVTLSNGAHFVTDWGYTFPTYYAHCLNSKQDFACYGKAQLLY
jgi:hypothetical protein